MDKEQVYVGQWVVYRPYPSAAPEDGTVMSLDALERGIAHVRYRGDLGAKATYITDLVPGKDEE